MGRIAVITGEDDFLAGEAAKKIVGDGVGLEVIDSALSTTEELQLRDLRAVVESILTPPFFDPRKTTWWKNANFLPGGGKAKGDAASGEEGGARTSEAVKEALAKLADTVVATGLPENQSLVITAPKLLATSTFAKKLAKVAEMTSFAKPKGYGAAREAVATATERARALGLEFSFSAAERFIARVGSDTRSIHSELEKMLAYKGGPGKITEQDVDEISSPGAGVEPVLWDVTDALSMRDVDKCIAAARRFEDSDGYTVMITTVIERRLRELVEAKSAEAEGRLGEATSSMAPWAARKLENALSRWTLNELRGARMRFMALREASVSSAGRGLADSIAIEIVRACARARKGGGR